MRRALPITSWLGLDGHTSFEGGFKRADPLIETGDLVVQPMSRTTTGPTVLWEICNGGVRLLANKPITVHFRVEGTHWFAENENLRVFAHGKDMRAALDDFQSHVVYFFQHYGNLRENQLMGEAVELKRLFAQSFRHA